MIPELQSNWSFGLKVVYQSLKLYNVYKWSFWATQLEFIFICFPLNSLLWMKFSLCYSKRSLLYIVTVQGLILMNFSSETKVSTKLKFTNQYSIHELSSLNLTYFHSPYITNPPVFKFSNCSCFSSSFKKNMTLNTTSNSLKMHWHKF